MVFFLFLSDDYLDIGLKLDGVYAYTKIAKDDSGLESETMVKKEIKLKEPKKEFQAFRNTSFAYNEDDNSVTLEWECYDPEDIQLI